MNDRKIMIYQYCANNDSSSTTKCISLDLDLDLWPWPWSWLVSIDSSSDDDSIFEDARGRHSSHRSSDSSPSIGGGDQSSRVPPGGAIYANIHIPGNSARSALADLMKTASPQCKCPVCTLSVSYLSPHVYLFVILHVQHHHVTPTRY